MSTDSVCITLASAKPYDVVVGNETIDIASLTVGGPGSEPTLIMGSSSAEGTLSANISGAVDIAHTAAVTLAAPGAFSAALSTGSITNAGTFSAADAATLTLSAGSTFDNAGGTISNSTGTFAISSPSGQTATVKLESGGVVDNSGTITVDDTVDVNGGSICGNQLGFGASGVAQTLAFAATPGTGPACGGGVATDHIQVLNVAATLSGTIPASYTLGGGASGVAYQIALSGDVINDGTIVLGVAGYQGTVSAASSADYLTNNGTLTSTSGGAFNASLINNGTANFDGPLGSSPETSSLQDGWSWENTGTGTITVGSGDALEMSSPSGQTATVKLESGGVVDNSGTITVDDTVDVNGGSICGNQLGFGASGVAQTLAFAATPGTGPACGGGVASDHIQVLNVAATLSGTIPASYTLGGGASGVAYQIALSGDVINDGTIVLGVAGYQGTVSAASSADYLTNNGTLTATSGGAFNAPVINDGALNIDGSTETSSLQNGWSWENTAAGTITVGSGDALEISSPSGQSADFIQDGVIDNSGTLGVADPITVKGGTICNKAVNLGSGDTGASSGETLTLSFAASPTAGPACSAGQATDQLFIYNVNATIETNIPAGYSVAIGDGGPSFAAVGTPGNLTNAGTLEPEWGMTLTIGPGGTGTLTNTGTIEAPATGYPFPGNIDAGAVDNTSGNVKIADSSSLAISGTYSQGSQGTFTPQIDGTAAGTTYGQLTATGGSTLAGTLDIDTVSGFSPTSGNTFEVIKGGDVAGTFGTVLGKYPPPNTSAYGVTYDADDVTLNVSGQTSTPLTVSESGDGSGTVSSAPAGIDCGSTCTAGFPQNQNVTLTENPASGSVFTGWSGDCSGTSTTCEVTLSSAQSVGASFIVPPNTTTSLESSMEPSAVGQKVTYTATVSPAPDGGTVAFTDGGSTISGCASVDVSTSTGVATCGPTYSAVGSHTIQASYSGDTDFGSSLSSTQIQIVDAASTTTTLQSSANPSLEAQKVTYTASVSPVPDGGTVAFTDGGSTISGCGSATVNTATGEATCQATYASTGAHTIEASYSGDTNYGGSDTGPFDQVVNAAGTSTSLQSSANPSLPGQQVTYTATVSPTPDGGAVAFTDGGSTISGCGSVAVDTSTGKATCQVTYASTGSHQIAAAYSGDTLDGASTGNLTQVVAATSTATSLQSSENPSLPGQQVTYTATVSPVPDGGTVTFTDGGSTITGCDSVAVDTTTGAATCQATYASSGSHSIEADFSGDTLYAASHGNLTQVVSSTSTALASSANPSLPGQQVTYTATVSPVPDGGTIAFTDGGSSISGCDSVSVDTGTGEASCQATYVSVGSHPIQATYSGDANFAGSQSSTLTQTVSTTSTSTSLQSSENPSLPGQQVSFTATVSPVPDGGTVAFTDGGATISGCGSVAVNTTTGAASCQATYASSGSHGIEGDYSGDTLYAPSHGNLTQVVSSTSTALASSANPSLPGQQVTYTASVSPVPDGGTVTFTDGGSTITGCDSVSVDTSTGKASCQATYASLGSHPIQATYAGDANFAGSQSAILNQVVSATSTSTSLRSSANPSLLGQHVTYTATVSPAPDGGTIAFTDGGATISGCGSVAVNTTTGAATCQATYASSGSHGIEGDYSGDTLYAASHGNLTQVVKGLTPTTTTLQSSANPSPFRSPVTFTATVSPVPDGGTVKFTENGELLCNAAGVNTSTGKVTCTNPGTGFGPGESYTLQASYSGDAQFSGSQSATLTEAVEPHVVVPTTAAIQASKNPVAVGEQVTLTATVSPVPDGGTVKFFGSSCVSVPVNTSTGEATCTLAFPQGGVFLPGLEYSGDANFSPAYAFGSPEYVPRPPFIEPVLTERNAMTTTVSCGGSCSGGVTVTESVPAAQGASTGGLTASAKRKKRRTKTITLGRAHFTIRGKGSVKLTIPLTKAGKKLLAAHHGRLTAKARFSEKTKAGTLVTTRTIKIAPAKPKKK